MAKILKKGLVMVIITALILTLTPCTALAKEFEPRLTSPNGEPYYTRKLNVYSQQGYGMPNCVAYAYGRLYELNGEAPKLNRGDAGQWWSINKRNGYYEYGDVAERGAVACWSNHVAIVEEINNDGSITVSESHWGGKYFNTKTYYNMSRHYGQKFYGYIYAYTPSNDEEEAQETTQAQTQEKSYNMEESHFELQEKTAFSSLEFKMSNNNIMNPQNSFILN